MESPSPAAEAGGPAAEGGAAVMERAATAARAADEPPAPTPTTGRATRPP
ncbi:hypothetical protein ACIBKZ_12435 [Streptomyces sp. NPDC050421]